MTYKCHEPILNYMKFLYYKYNNILNQYENYYLILKSMAATRLKKVGTRPCLPLCSLPPSFNTVKYNLKHRTNSFCFHTLSS